jgi:hypothetical protein
MNTLDEGIKYTILKKKSKEAIYFYTKKEFKKI